MPLIIAQHREITQSLIFRAVIRTASSASSLCRSCERATSTVPGAILGDMTSPLFASNWKEDNIIPLPEGFHYSGFFCGLLQPAESRLHPGGQKQKTGNGQGIPGSGIA